MKLEDIRIGIDKVDKKLIELLDERMALSSEVAKEKLITGAAVLSNEREQIILEKIDAAGVNNPSEIKSVMQAIMTMSREKQYNVLLHSGKAFNLGNAINEAKGHKINILKVAYSGKNGSYGEAAAKKMYPDASLFIGCKSFGEACHFVVTGECDVAVLPLENTTAGTVNEVYDLIPINKLYIIKSMSDIISHNLLAIKGASIIDIETVVSHPQALSQCSNIINKMGWDTIECNNTAYAAEEVAEKGDKSIAAIGSAVSAEVYGLDIININVNNEQCNQTRFVALSKELSIDKNAGKISLAFKLPHKTGALAWVLFLFASLSLNLTKIQSRPITDRPWEYIFYADFLYNEEDKAMQALFQLEKELPELILLGWYQEK